MIIAILTGFIVIIIILIREKLKLKAELERERANKLYDEINPVPQVNMNTTENVAYSGASND